MKILYKITEKKLPAEKSFLIMKYIK